MVHTHQRREQHARERVRVSDDSLPHPRFESAAIYSEWLAQKETRGSDRQEWLLKLARFYRSLAGIIPALPTSIESKYDRFLHARSVGTR